MSNELLNAMTVDVEDYFHVSAFEGVLSRAAWPSLESRVERNTERVLSLMAERGVRGTFFVLALVAEQFPSLVRRIADAGHEVASHGYAHRVVYDQTPSQFRQDVRRAKAIIQDAAGVQVFGYRAPSYSITPRSLWALDVLIEEGYAYDASVFPIRHDRYGIPQSMRHVYELERPAGRLVEVPASTTRLAGTNLPIAGGGYFRLLPYAWTRWGISRVNRLERRPAVFYIHPWEFDPDQPRIPAGALSRLRHYRNLGDTERRFRRLLQDFRFGTLKESVLHWSPATDGHGLPLPLPYLW